MVNIRQQGSALALTLLGLALMGALILTLNKLVLSYHNSSSNTMDYELAQNCARFALLTAEEQVRAFDAAAQLENPVGAEVIVVRRFNILNLAGGGFNIIVNGTTCNPGGDANRKGWCYQPLAVENKFAQTRTFLPWQLTASGLTKPCNSYTLRPGDLPILDGRNSTSVVAFNTGDNSLCIQPRYIMEPVNLDYRGNEAGNLVQANGVNLVINPARSARVYRITVRAFGKNGDTRVTLQEYVAISQSSANLSQQILPLSVRWLRDD